LSNVFKFFALRLVKEYRPFVELAFGKEKLTVAVLFVWVVMVGAIPACELRPFCLFSFCRHD